MIYESILSQPAFLNQPIHNTPDKSRTNESIELFETNQ